MRHFLGGLLILIGCGGCVRPYVYPHTGIVQARLEAQAADAVAHPRPLDSVIQPARPAKEILVLSGGGMYGAYTSGFLAGWSETGRRPEFDVVTGVSTGALAGLAAFLGPNYDGVAREFYTATRAEDVYNFRAWVVVPWADSLATSKPLKALIEAAVDETILAAIAREHRRGRRFYVGTTCLESRKFVVWDMGAIACKGPEALGRFRDIVLASCSVPGIMPPVPLRVQNNGVETTELHVDGGTSASLFVPKGLLAAGPNGAPSNANVYVLLAGKLFHNPDQVRSRVLPVLGASMNSLLYGSARAEIAIIHHLTRLGGANFHLTAVPADDTADPDGLQFDTQEMKRLYDMGYKAASSGPAWLPAPPFESAATDPPRE